VGRPLAAPLLLAALLALPGCFYGPPLSGSASTSSDEAAAQTNVRASIPALEAYYADNGTYAGATLEVLRRTYDAGLPDVQFIGRFTRSTYCVQSTVGAATFSKAGPAAEILPGPCGSSSEGTATLEAPPAPAHTDAEEAVLGAIPLVEAYQADHGSYTGVEDVSELYGASLGDVRIVVLRHGRAYCVEAPSAGPSAHFDGPQGPLASGPCR
jgi:hypothetical protein